MALSWGVYVLRLTRAKSEVKNERKGKEREKSIIKNKVEEGEEKED